MLFLINIFVFILVAIKFKRSFASLPGFSYATLVIFGVPGSYIVLNIDDWWLRDISLDSIEIGYYIYNSLILLTSGLVTIYLINETKKKQYKYIIIYKNKDDLIFLISAIAIFFIAIIFLFPDSPLYNLINNPSIDALILAELRGKMRPSYEMNILLVYFKNIFINYYLFYILIYFSIQRLVFGYGGRMFIIVLFITLFCFSLDLAKSPILHITIALAMIEFYFKGLNIMKIILFISIGLFSLVSLYIFVMGAHGIETIEMILHRTFIAQYAGFPITLDIFPRLHPHTMWYTTTGLLSKLYGVEPAFYSKIAMEFVNPEHSATGSAGFMSTVAFAEGYAANGLIGLFSAYIMIVIFVFLFSRARYAVELKYVSMHILLLNTIPYLMMDSTSSIVINYGVYFIFFVILLIRIFSFHFSKSKGIKRIAIY